MAQIKNNFKFKDMSRKSRKTNISESIMQKSRKNILAESSRNSENYVKAQKLSENIVISQTSTDKNKNSKIFDKLNENLKDKDIAGIDLTSFIWSCMSVEENNEIPAKTIKRNKNGEYELIKLANIKFNLKKFLGSLVNFSMAVISFVRKDFYFAMLSGINAVLSFEEAKTIPLDETCGKVLEIIYRESEYDGMDKKLLISKIQDSYGKDFDENTINGAIESLSKYRCIELDKDKVILCETLCIEYEYK